MSDDTLGTFSGRLQGAEEKLTLTFTGDVYQTLRRLSTRMRNADTPQAVVEIALELISKAEGKEIALLESGRVVTTYNLWK